MDNNLQSSLIVKEFDLPSFECWFISVQTSSPELGILCTIDEDIDGAVTREEKVAHWDHDAEEWNPGWGNRDFCQQYACLNYSELS